MSLSPDGNDLSRFVKTLFRYADSNTFASLRAFDQFQRGSPATFIRAVHINGSLSPLIEAAIKGAEDAANTENSVVFAPPICTFTNPNRARRVDLANGLAISVEIDDGDTVSARQRLEAILGPATVVVASGGDWADPATGEVFTKLHLHWRLSEPTRTQEEHDQLLQARNLASWLAGADPTGKPVVHPLRWPGSWHTKERPRLAKIAAINESIEVHLSVALERLQEAAEAAGLADVGIAQSGEPEAPPELVAAAMEAIPNPDAHYDEWVRYGYACYRAAGAEQGFAIWDAWSQKSAKYNAKEQEVTWRRISRAIEGSTAPRTVGAGTIFFHAKAAGWVRPEPEFGMFQQREQFQQEYQSSEPSSFRATPVTQAELDALAPRQWVYGHFLIRRFISAIGAPGGAGKTAYAYAVALSVMTGSELLKETVHDPGNVWIYNLEDPRDELLKRLQAALIGHGIEFLEISERIFLDSGRDRPLVIAQTGKDGTVIAWPQVPALIAELKARAIRLFIVDPFVRSHRVEENVNDQIDAVAALWAQVADQADCSVLLVHHFKKGGQSGDADAFRGATALIDASRAAVTLGRMSQDEAKRFDIPENERWQYVRADNAKLNLAPPPDQAVWLRLTGVDIGNASIGRPSDHIQTVERWSPPSPWVGFSMAVVLRVLELINAGPGDGEQYTLTRGGRSARWAGLVIVREGQKSEAQAAAILRAWVASGLVQSGRYFSPTQRKERDGLMVDPQKLAEIRQGTSSAPWSEEMG